MASQDSIRSINVLLQYTNSQGVIEEININEQGLIEMNFNRFLGDTANLKSGLLTDLNLTMFDKTGYTLLTIFQRNEGKLKIRYGFENDLSPVYDLTILKLRSNRNNLAVMASVAAIGRESVATFGPEAYLEGAPIQEILIKMARRNGWNIGNGNSQVDTDGLVLTWPLLLEPDETDIEFIKNKILPLANRTVSNAEVTSLQFWDVTLYADPEGQTQFYFRKYADKRTPRTIWKYYYGSTDSGSVLDLTDTIDYTFLLNGLTIKVAAEPSDYLGADVATVADYYSNEVFKQWNLVEAMFREANLPVPAEDQFALKIEFVPVEQASSDSLVEKIFKAIRSAIMSIYSIEMEVIGNHKIRPMDIIRLDVRNKSGVKTILSGDWKVVLISEAVGQKGFTTKLNLVRSLEEITLIASPQHSREVE